MFLTHSQAWTKVGPTQNRGLSRYQMVMGARGGLNAMVLPAHFSRKKYVNLVC